MKLNGLDHKNLYNLFTLSLNMPTQDTSQLKEKILSILRQRGPSLPVHIASGTGLSMLFASAFLAELLSEKKIIISYLKVGNSPLYLLEGHEYKLENFAEHLKSKEKDAFRLLQKSRFLKDIDQHPAIRVALRAIRDFAIPFKQNEEIYWRYFIASPSEFEVPKVQPKKQEIFQEPERKNSEELNIFEKENEEKIKEEPKKVIKKVIKKKKVSKKKDDIFFNKVKEFLSKKSIIIVEVESLSKNQLILKVKSHNKETLLFAYNKMRITELEIIKASKKANELSLPYTLLSKGGPLKKTENFIEALKNLDSIETLK
jgi:hypothetical protein